MYIMSNRTICGANREKRGQHIMDIIDIIPLSHEDGKITIHADKEFARDLAYVLSSLLDFAHTLRAKITHARALQAACNEVDIAQRRTEFERRSTEVFCRFQSHLNNGCHGDKAKALQCIKQDFNMGYGEAQIYVIEGRRLLRKATDKRPDGRRRATRKSKSALRMKTPTLPLTPTDCQGGVSKPDSRVIVIRAEA